MIARQSVTCGARLFILTNHYSCLVGARPFEFSEVLMLLDYTGRTFTHAQKRTLASSTLSTDYPVNAAFQGLNLFF
jgi:hypothetical protein